MSLLRKQESRFIPAKAGTQTTLEFYILDSHFRGNDNPKSPAPGLAEAQAGLSTARERRVVSFG